MKNKILLFASIVAVASTAAIVLPSCKKKFDTPPAAADPVGLTPTHTIKQLKAMHTVAGQLDVITTDVIIAGTVVADDKSGNLYKEIYIQDATGGLAIELDATGLYTTYPVGRKIFINCKGLCISDYHRLHQLGIKATISGSPTSAAIPSDLIKNYITGGSLNNPVVPKVVTTASLTTAMTDDNLGTLIQLNNFEFAKGDTSSTYSDTSAYKQSKNLTTRDCSGNSIIIRTSGYANFAAAKPAKGNGSIAAIYTTYDATPQLILRDTTDVKFTGARCNLFEEDFNAYPVTGTAPLVIPGWKNIMETGDVPYTIAFFSTAQGDFAKVSAFSSAVMPTTNISSWLISPDITLPTGVNPMYTFTCSRRYPVATLKAYVSTNYTGGAPSSATWVLLGTVPNGTATAFTPFDLFGPYNLTAYIGQKINLAFRYEAPAGSAASNVATYEIDDIKISK